MCVMLNVFRVYLQSAQVVLVLNTDTVCVWRVLPPVLHMTYLSTHVHLPQP